MSPSNEKSENQQSKRSGFAMLKQLKVRLKELSRSERKVADWVLAHLEETPQLNIAELSAFADVSEPTIVRFCKSIGCHGFQNFKLKLTQELALGQDPSISLDPQDSVAHLKVKLLDLHRSALHSFAEELNETSIELAITALEQANHIIVCGYGSSGGLAQDTAYRLFQIIQTVQHYQDPHLTGLACANLKRHDILLALCQTGNTRELFDHCLIAKRQEATLISICPFSSPIANVADLALATITQSDHNLTGTIIERSKHLIILDLLVAGLYRSKTTTKPKIPPFKLALKNHFIEQPDLVEQAQWLN